uniref:Phytanoyl-CoA dioxygenase domain-containing protein 1 n=2 Tax=Anthurium amnicola TaxID=1678845 RepID=A0A1D1YMI7_9ARAE
MVGLHPRHQDQIDPDLVGKMSTRTPSEDRKLRLLMRMAREREVPLYCRAGRSRMMVEPCRICGMTVQEKFEADIPPFFIRPPFQEEGRFYPPIGRPRKSVGYRLPWKFYCPCRGTPWVFNP